MSPKPYEPNWRPDRRELGPTDLASLVAVPDIETPGVERDHRRVATDFQSLRAEGFLPKPKAPQPRSATDWVIDVLTPILIFVMSYAVVFFLLDVRYVFTSVHDANLRLVALSFLVGIVALNRLVARDGESESLLYFAALAGAIGLYTLGTTSLYDVGSIARGFMDDPWIATGFNMTVVIFLWWAVNRLTHECCVDENTVAGDVGLVTGAVKRLEARVARGREQPRPATGPGPLLYREAELTPFDPVEGYVPPVREEKPPALSVADRLPRRHPGMSIFVFSGPVMLIFSVGIAVVRNAGPAWVQAGAFYMGLYTACALALLMLTSLGGLREYFRSRGVRMPGALGVYWIALGTLMTAVVMVAAARLPRPELPPPIHVGERETDPWARGADYLELEPVSAAPLALLEQSRFLERTGNMVLAALGALLLYGLLRGILIAADALLLRPGRAPRWVVWILGRLAALIRTVFRVPRVPRARRIRIQRDIATCAQYANSLGDPEAAERMTPADHVEHAYAALCALAYDMGVPRHLAQTPIEFLRAFPHELRGLREAAEDLTQLYLVAAYSPLQLDQRALDRVRKFWLTYDRVRMRVVR
jgi:hypothetical protein